MKQPPLTRLVGFQKQNFLEDSEMERYEVKIIILADAEDSSPDIIAMMVDDALCNSVDEFNIEEIECQEVKR